MFWGCFSGKYGKGPGLFWEKDWGTITAESYQAYTIPIVDGWMRMSPGQIFMQDNAPGHAHSTTVQDLIERGIQWIEWPAFSPDLNPIENVWNWMKEWIWNHYPEDKMSYEKLRKAVMEAWEAVPDDYLQNLVKSIKERCQAVIAANGMHTKY
jgi:transposase